MKTGNKGYEVLPKACMASNFFFTRNFVPALYLRTGPED